MAAHSQSSHAPGKQGAPLSLYHLLDPEVLANPYPLYHKLRSEDPVHWDPYLHAWIVTRYADVVTVFQRFSANRTYTPEQLETLGLSALKPLAQVMIHQMLFLDPPDHTRIRGLASKAFTPRRVAILRSHIQDIPIACWMRYRIKGRWMSSPTSPIPCPPSSRRRCWAFRPPTGSNSRPGPPISPRCSVTSSTIPITPQRRFAAWKRWWSISAQPFKSSANIRAMG